MMKMEETRRRELIYSEILQSLGELPERLRKVFVLQHYQGCGPLEIARALQVSEEEVPFLVNRAEQHFYRALSRVR